jgi:ubiquinone/menaquinone biosynthesis C-methylase UbiE
MRPDEARAVNPAADVFDRQAATYDRWYDSLRGRAIFAEERAALAPLVGHLRRPWLEVGTGTGRFAVAFAIDVGLDPAAGALTLAARRGVPAVRGVGEALPFRDGAFGGVACIATLCFVADPTAVLREARRVLRPDGGVVLGIIPGESPWAEVYRRRAAEGDSFYAGATFVTRAALASHLAAAALRWVRTRSALLWPPVDQPQGVGAQEGDASSAGFLAVLARPAR